MHKEIEKIVQRAIGELSWEGVSGDVSVPKSAKHGDYSTSAPFRAAQISGGDSMAQANQLAEKIKGYGDPRIEKIEAVAPGFVNFFLSKESLKSELAMIIEKGEDYGSSRDGEGKTMIIDYSSPNIAKSFGVGHLRSTIIGQAIYNIYSFLGWRCIGDNHLGDWGTQFGKLIFQIKKSGLEDDIESLTINELEKLYVSFHRDAEKDPGLEEKGREWFKKLESGDKDAGRIWEACVKTSIKEFNRIYSILGVEIDMVLGESFYALMARDVIKELKEKGLIKESEGALVIEFSDKNLPSLIVVKSDGTSTYLARDLATIKYRIEKWNPNLIVYEVGSDQSLYFRQLFETAKLLGWSDKTNLVHIAHGLVRWKHGKFSTRKGETIHLEDMLNETIKRAREVIDSSGISSELSDEERTKVAKMVGIGAVKYNDLSQHYSRDIIFDWEKMLNLKGNSAPYIQYTFARTESVLEKVGREINSGAGLGDINDEESAVIRRAILFPYIIQEAGRTISPNVICSFLFDLARDYNAMYDKHRIIGADNQDVRVAITAAVNQVLKNGLTLLGISAPQRM